MATTIPVLEAIPIARHQNFSSLVRCNLPPHRNLHLVWHTNLLKIHRKGSIMISNSALNSSNRDRELIYSNRERNIGVLEVDVPNREIRIGILKVDVPNRELIYSNRELNRGVLEVDVPNREIRIGILKVIAKSLPIVRIVLYSALEASARQFYFGSGTYSAGVYLFMNIASSGLLAISLFDFLPAHYKELFPHYLQTCWAVFTNFMLRCLQIYLDPPDYIVTKLIEEKWTALDVLEFYREYLVIIARNKRKEYADLLSMLGDFISMIVHKRWSKIRTAFTRFVHEDLPCMLRRLQMDLASPDYIVSKLKKEGWTTLLIDVLECYMEYLVIIARNKRKEYADLLSMLGDFISMIVHKRWSKIRTGLYKTRSWIRKVALPNSEGCSLLLTAFTRFVHADLPCMLRWLQIYLAHYKELFPHYLQTCWAVFTNFMLRCLQIYLDPPDYIVTKLIEEKWTALDVLECYRELLVIIARNKRKEYADLLSMLGDFISMIVHKRWSKIRTGPYKTRSWICKVALPNSEGCSLLLTAFTRFVHADLPCMLRWLQIYLAHYKELFLHYLQTCWAVFTNCMLRCLQIYLDPPDYIVSKLKEEGWTALDVLECYRELLVIIARNKRKEYADLLSMLGDFISMIVHKRWSKIRTAFTRFVPEDLPCMLRRLQMDLAPPDYIVSKLKKEGWTTLLIDVLECYREYLVIIARNKRKEYADLLSMLGDFISMIVHKRWSKIRTVLARLHEEDLDWIVRFLQRVLAWYCTTGMFKELSWIGKVAIPTTGGCSLFLTAAALALVFHLEHTFMDFSPEMDESTPPTKLVYKELRKLVPAEPRPVVQE